MGPHAHEVTMGRSTVSKKFSTWADDEARREWACLRLLAEHAPGLAPRPLERFCEAGAPVIVMEKLPGQPLGGSSLTSVQHEALGHALHLLFEVPVNAALKSGVPERRLGPRDLMAHLRNALHDQIDDDACIHPDVVRRALQAARDRVSSVQDAPNPRSTAVGIADLNPANVLWDGHRCRLVDFEDGGLTTPAFDLADHLEHLSARTRNLYDEAQLSRAVGLTGDERTDLAEHRVLWAVFWLLALLPGSSAHTRNPEGTLEVQAEHVLGLIQASKDAPGAGRSP
ncbi:aminoglycoside phosphotransferase family protein [Brachybacterium sp. ACRRE]|uniref:aminoglycoside phosphotransferase family protein n=1 Tax=Brachybacterium sp. ACRRE TaxID=2918184 RepID=UPI001EF2A91D|nr:aminoglycoside phosphotransferase family protein [Brachybacterium sp. ACRRE]MCG7310157.1 aminoglycoside phosphotransferase family protein [Brachybacterium sp. ACRRE]